MRQCSSFTPADMIQKHRVNRMRFHKIIHSAIVNCTSSDLRLSSSGYLFLTFTIIDKSPCYKEGKTIKTKSSHNKNVHVQVWEEEKSGCHH